MHIQLKKRPKSPIIIEGFPGFGMVGAIAAEFLIEHLKTELIGKIVLESTPAVAAIHEGKFVEPFGIFYNRKYNIVVFHSLMPAQGQEWDLAGIVLDLARQLKAKEIISLEGVGSVSEDAETHKVLYYATSPAKESKFKKLKLDKLNEGIILGITAAILVKNSTFPVSCIFAETHTNLPDSKAAAKVIQTLDQYLGLKVDYKPLLVMAEKFEAKLQGIMQQSTKAQQDRDKKACGYIG
ncbi:proteasome assembly chaperone family protein [Candidatus Woesearchaeota archaeon]|nr:proteasome assembly chaperone family protein [Candidatus Woesearchaeota archaeon]